MVLFLSGNFPQLSSLTKEKAFADFTEQEGSGYNRLMTFYYKENCDTILLVAKTVKIDQARKRLTKRKVGKEQ